PTECVLQGHHKPQRTVARICAQPQRRKTGARSAALLMRRSCERRLQDCYRSSGWKVLECRILVKMQFCPRGGWSTTADTNAAWTTLPTSALGHLLTSTAFARDCTCQFDFEKLSVLVRSQR